MEVSQEKIVIAFGQSSIITNLYMNSRKSDLFRMIAFITLQQNYLIVFAL